MVRLEEAVKIAARFVEELNQKARSGNLARLTGIIPEKLVLCESCGETKNKYVFQVKHENGVIAPSGSSITVDKTTAECKCEYLERDGDKLWSPIKGYKHLKELTNDS